MPWYRATGTALGCLNRCESAQCERCLEEHRRNAANGEGREGKLGLYLEEVESVEQIE